MRLLEIFAGSSTMSDYFRSQGWEVVTVDIKQYRGCSRLTHCVDVLEFDISIYQPGYFDFVWFGLPCTTFSKASGGFHFIDNAIPVTTMAVTSISLLYKCYEIIKYLAYIPFFLENPAGGLCNNYFWQNHHYFSKLLFYRVPLASFGFPTQKKTDLFTNLDHLILTPDAYRVNGRYSKQKFANLSTNQRQKYPVDFCAYVFEQIKPHFEKTSSGATQ